MSLLRNKQTLFREKHPFYPFSQTALHVPWSAVCCPILDTLVSSSPIIQNGKLIGAVTHVLVNDPTTGYGIFIENMLEAAA